MEIKEIEDKLWKLFPELKKDLEEAGYDADEILGYINAALRQDRKDRTNELVKILEEIIQEERYAGAPHALNKAIQCFKELEV